jgi:hypothetical protein
MRRLIGPLLHLQQGTVAEWRFAVGVWVQEPQPDALTLVFAADASATVDAAPSALGEFAGGTWLSWNVRIPRRDAEFDTGYTITGLDADPIAIDMVCVPGRGQGPRIAFFSCNGVQDPKHWTTQPEMEALWTRMRERHTAGVCPDGSGGRYHVMFGGGDQIYCDSVWTDIPRLKKLDTWDKRKKAKVTPALEQDIEKHYAGLYRRWSRSFFADMHARVPTLHTWDDHDIFDGWGSYDEELQSCALFQSIFGKAKAAYRLLQLGGAPLQPSELFPSTPSPTHALQAVRFDDRIDVLLLDLRSDRTETRVMSDAQWTDLRAYFATRQAQPSWAPHLLVVSSIPVVYLNFATAQKFLDWFPWRQDLEDDLYDQWESPSHQEERARLVMTLLDHAKATETRVTLLSGDVHVGARGRIVSRRPEHVLPPEPEASIHQLTSSAIVYPPPPALALAGMRTISAEGPTPLLAVSNVETEVVRVSADHYLLGKRNWLSIEPGTAAKQELWVRWLTDNGDVKPPLVVHRRTEPD